MRTFLKKIKQKAKSMTFIFEDLDTFNHEKGNIKTFLFWKFIEIFLSINLWWLTFFFNFCLTCLIEIMSMCLYVLDWVNFLSQSMKSPLNILIISMIFILQYLCWLLWYNWIYMFPLNDYAWFWIWYVNYLIKIHS